MKEFLKAKPEAVIINRSSVSTLTYSIDQQKKSDLQIIITRTGFGTGGRVKQKRKGTQPKLFVRPGTFKISGGSREGAPFPLILGGKKKRIAEGRKAGRATDKKS